LFVGKDTQQRDRCEEHCNEYFTLYNELHMRKLSR